MSKNPQKNPQKNLASVKDLGLTNKEEPFVTCTKRGDMTGDVEYVTETFKVLASRNGRPVAFGPDDATYAQHKGLLQKVPRGFSRLRYTYRDGHEHEFILKGVTKFDGTTKFDEDTPMPESQHGLMDQGEIKQWEADGELLVQFQDKANGKFAIFALLLIDESWYIFGGSKNVHAMYMLGKIGSFVNIDGDDLHHDILNCIVGDLRKLSPEEIAIMDRKTFVGEYCDGKHMVYTDTPYMAYFVMGAPVSLPRVAHILPSQRSFPTIDQFAHIRRAENCEGVVICYTNTRTGAIIRQKHKSIWYTILRCWREMMKRVPNKFDGRVSLVHRMIKRMKERSDQFLHLDADEIAHYTCLAWAFTEWILASKYDFTDADYQGVGIAKIYFDFVTDGGLVNLDKRIVTVAEVQAIKNTDPTLIDTIDMERSGFPGLTISDLIASPRQDIYVRNYVAEKLLADVDMFHLVTRLAVNHKVAVITRGPPGSGKTSVANLLRREFKSCEVFCTDDYFVNSANVYEFVPNKLKEYHAKNLEAFTASDAPIKINANTNMAQWEWQQYATVARNQGYVIIMLNTKVESPDTLADRTLHGVPEAHIKRMIRKMKPTPPMYYGLFVSGLLNDWKYVMNTPAHVTCAFVGGKPNADAIPRKRFVDDGPGCIMDIKVFGINTNKAGRALVVEIPIGTQATVPHITLEVFDGYSPVQVGSMILSGNTVLFNEPVVIKGINGCTW